jgi:uncharacterized protein (DUF1810 family)
MADPYNLQRFLDAQEPHFGQVCAELEAGRKRSHWMWYIFPQIKGLGGSEMAQRYAISSLDEAVAYIEHPVLGERLKECTRMVVAVSGRTVDQIFDYPDNVKFHSSITLFSRAAPDEAVFEQALEKYFGGQGDPATLERLGRVSTRR